jgi:hypothetical protein
MKHNDTKQAVAMVKSALRVAAFIVFFPFPIPAVVDRLIKDDEGKS